MRKIWYILRQMFSLIGKHKLAFMTPILVMLALLAFLVYYFGPAVVITFLYAGV